MIFRKLYLFAIFLSLSLSLEAVDVSGTIYYERVQPKHSGGSSLLNYSNITKERAKEVFVEAINLNGNQVASTFTSENGEYKLEDLPSESSIKIRVYAKMFKQNHWDVKVIDNKNKDALYVIEGDFIDTGSVDTIRDLTASAKDKGSPPFAILDSIYQAMSKVYSVDSKVNFPKLNINWSVDNINSGTYYDGEDDIVLQGDQAGDSDEYDGHIVIHEWGHFFENKFSRADNIGGIHGTGNYLDIRVAFGEGFGNALSAIVTDDPVYFDTFGDNGWNMNIETARHNTPGWFSEASIQRILYDLYDNHDDNKDKLSLGFKPIYDVLVGGQRVTSAFTSIFSFIYELKKENPNDTSKIDEIIASENISTIEDIYGSNRISNIEGSVLPLYQELTIGKTLKDICTTTEYGLYNKLGDHKYIYFTITKDKKYPILVKQSNGSRTDPNFTLFKTDPFEKISKEESTLEGLEKATINLVAGNYMLDISERSAIVDKACFNVSVGDVNDSIPTVVTNSSSSVAIALPKNIFLATILLLAILFVPLFFIRKELKL